MKTVIYHSADFDGIFCREVAKRFLGTEGVTYIGWTHGDPKIPFPLEGEVYILDLSPECIDYVELIPDPQWRRICWIDHHKTSIEKWSSTIPGYRIDGVAACRLAWQWFYDPNGEGKPWAQKHNFVNREVLEPLAVRLAGEYDIWDHRGDGDLELQFGLRCVEPLPWNDLLTPAGIGQDQTVNHLLNLGKTAMAYANHIDADLVKYLSFQVAWEGLHFLCLNTARCNPNTFAALDKPETRHDALLAFYFQGKQWIVSMYHAAHNKELDLSAIAKKYGGGGHKGACGFQCNRLFFLEA